MANHPLTRARVWRLHTPRDASPYVRIHCDTCDATDDVNCKVNSPPHFIANKFKQRGWKIRGEGKRATCSECQKTPPAKPTADVTPAVKPEPATALPPGRRLAVVPPAPAPKPYERPVTKPVLGKAAAAELAAEIDELARSPKYRAARALLQKYIDAGNKQADAARLAGVSQSTISRLARNDEISRDTTLNKIIDALNDHTTDAKTPMTTSTPAPPAKPSQASRKALRQVFALLEDHYDEDRSAYSDGWSDARIAEATGIAVEVVTAHREDAFGPIVDPVVERIEKRIAEIETRFIKDRDDAVELFRAALQEAQNEISKLRAEVRALKNP